MNHESRSAERRDPSLSVICYCEISRTWTALISVRKPEWAALKLWSKQDGACKPLLCSGQLVTQGIRINLNSSQAVLKISLSFPARVLNELDDCLANFTTKNYTWGSYSLFICPSTNQQIPSLKRKAYYCFKKQPFYPFLGQENLVGSLPPYSCTNIHVSKCIFKIIFLSMVLYIYTV
jgi:hypothetical protein